MDYIVAKTFALSDFFTWKIFLSAVTSVACFFFNELYMVGVLAVVMLMIFDVITGIMASWQEGKQISSQRFARSVKKGIVYMIAISAGHFVDQTIALKVARVVESTMITFVASTEFISILENVARLGYSTPQKLLNQMRDSVSRK